MAENALSIQKSKIGGNPEIDKYSGWKVESISKFMNRLYPGDYGIQRFPREVTMWQEDILYGLNVYSLIPPISLENIPDGVTPFAIMDGAMGRRFYMDSDAVLKVPAKLNESYRNSPLPDNVFYRNILNELPLMPLNSDFKVVCPDVSMRTEIFDRIDYMTRNNFGMASHSHTQTEQGTVWEMGSIHTPTKMRSTVQHIRHSNGVSVAKYSLTSGSTTFTSDITFFPNQEELARDLRRGPHLSSKQQPYAYVAVEESSDKKQFVDLICLAPDILVKDNTAVLTSKTEIQKPEYNSFQDAIIAGLQAIRLEGMWSSAKYGYVSSWFEQSTIEKYPQALKEAHAMFQNGKEKLNEFRVKEIIRNAIVCATHDLYHFFHNSRHLGILDIFFPEVTQQLSGMSEEEVAIKFIKYQQTYEESGPLALIRFLKDHGYKTIQQTEWGAFAEAFDIRRL